MSDKHEKQIRKIQETQQALRETIEQAKELAEKDAAVASQARQPKRTAVPLERKS
jgi:hypothetical protein